jgi:hypothetical protein
MDSASVCHVPGGSPGAPGPSRSEASGPLGAATSALLPQAVTSTIATDPDAKGPTSRRYHPERLPLCGTRSGRPLCVRVSTADHYPRLGVNPATTRRTVSRGTLCAMAMPRTGRPSACRAMMRATSTGRRGRPIGLPVFLPFARARAMPTSARAGSALGRLGLSPKMRRPRRSRRTERRA